MMEKFLIDRDEAMRIVSSVLLHHLNYEGAHDKELVEIEKAINSQIAQIDPQKIEGIDFPTNGRVFDR